MASSEASKTYGFENPSYAELMALHISFYGVLHFFNNSESEMSPIQAEAWMTLAAQESKLSSEQLFDLAARTNWVDGEPTEDTSEPTATNQKGADLFFVPNYRLDIRQ